MDPLAAIPQLVDVVLKGGVTGLLIIACFVMAMEIKRLRKQSAATFQQRDKARLALTLVRAAADAAGVKYDLRQIDELMKDDAAQAT